MLRWLIVPLVLVALGLAGVSMAEAHPFQHSAGHSPFGMMSDIAHDSQECCNEADAEQVTFDGLPARDYSMANQPGRACLEFHIRHVPGGATSEHVARSLKVGDKVSVRGPLGSSFLREGHPGPILAVGGGSGLAPIKSIVETALKTPTSDHGRVGRA